MGVILWILLLMMIEDGRAVRSLSEWYVLDSVDSIEADGFDLDRDLVKDSSRPSFILISGSIRQRFLGL